MERKWGVEHPLLRDAHGKGRERETDERERKKEEDCPTQKIVPAPIRCTMLFVRNNRHSRLAGLGGGTLFA